MKLLFVCLGNICRSPAAEAIMNKILEDRGLSSKVRCESAGTSGYHEGQPPDERMRQAGERRGLKFVTKSRPLKCDDFETFYRILVMDDRNYYDTLEMDAMREFVDKVERITKYNTRFKDADHIPDPYYGGLDGFDNVLDLLEDACSGLLEDLQATGKV